MTESVCTYTGNRDEALVTFLYGDDTRPDGERAAFSAHLSACAACRDELDSLRGIRAELGRWTPPEPNFAITFNNAPRSQSAFHQPSAISHQHWWNSVPAWAQVAAALLFLGVAAGLANLDVRYDQRGLSVRTGWSQPRGAASAPAAGAAAGAALASAPWKADLAALEAQLRTDMRAARAPASAGVEPAQAVAARAADADLLRRVRALVDESEKRQQRELALRVAEMMRDVSVQRQADLAKVNRALGAVENNLGVEVLKTRQQVNLMYRASQVVR